MVVNLGETISSGGPNLFNKRPITPFINMDIKYLSNRKMAKKEKETHPTS